jgi:hypothetical protein
MGEKFDRFPIIFTHASRTGGGCLSSVMGRQYRRAQIYDCYVRVKGGTTREALDEFLGWPLERKRGLKVLGGHLYFGLHRFYERYAYLTMFRDPVKRVVSLYSLALSNPGYYLHNLVISNRMKLKDFVGSGLSPELNNGQTRMLSGVEGVRFGECTREMFELARHNLDTHYPVFGITERYDESVLLMRRTFGWDTPYYRSRNVSRNELSKQPLSPETLAVIREHNALDIELSRHADERFQRMVDAEGPDFEQELARFRKVNGLVHRFSTPRNGYLALNLIQFYSRLRQVTR